MPVIAVAGGTGNLGRAVVDALNATGNITVLVLARQVSRRTRPANSP
jgi:nucleoside-diphosphate-sugar epimerase